MNLATMTPPPVDDLQRVALKVFLTNDSELDPRDAIPVFHRWIQTQAVTETSPIAGNAAAKRFP